MHPGINGCMLFLYIKRLAKIESKFFVKTFCKSFVVSVSAITFALQFQKREF